jgi:hypothetical protein
VTQSPYQQVLFNHPGFRVRYNSILSSLVAPDGPLSEPNLHALLDALEPVLSTALAEDPFVLEAPGATFQALRNWISERIPNVQAQVQANGPPSPR